MAETPTTRRELVELFYWNTAPGTLRAEVDNVLHALSAAGLAVVPLKSPDETRERVNPFDYEDVVAAADLLTKEE